MVKNKYFGRGKLLITGEYGVLDGAMAFAVPTKAGQTLTVKPQRGSDIDWKSLDKDGKSWFESTFSLIDFKAIKTTDETKSLFLQRLLKSAVQLNSEFLSQWNGFKIETKLDFDKDWGLGSSSSLTHIVAQWADVHPILLHFKANGGSGYDVACAGADTPILYQLNGESVEIEPLDDFRPKFGDSIHFVYLNKKQSTEGSIDYYQNTVKSKAGFVKSLTEFTEAIVETTKLSDFEKIIDEHEKLVGKTLKLKCIKDEHFSDYWGSIKSLGAWGGDFIMVTTDRDKATTQKYFADKGFKTFLGIEDLLI